MDKRAFLIALYNVLRDHSDADNPLSATQIISLLKTEYDISVGLKKLYRGIHALEEQFDISKYSDNYRGYYLISRTLNRTEVIQLCHSIHSNRSLPPNQIYELENRLLRNISTSDRKAYRESVFLDNPRNNGNRDWMLNIDLITDAIIDGKCIQFDYFHYDLNKNPIHRNKPYIKEPRYIVFNEARSYLIATDDHHKYPSHYRIDKMMNISILSERISSTFTKADAYEYAKKKLLMFSGAELSAEFLCKKQKNVFDLMIDELGKDVMFIDYDESYFKISIKSSFDGLVLFAQKYADILMPIYPEKLIKELEKRAQNYLDNLTVFSVSNNT